MPDYPSNVNAAGEGVGGGGEDGAVAVGAYYISTTEVEGEGDGGGAIDGVTSLGSSA